jgi:arylsulfatase
VIRASARQGGVPLQPARPQAHDLVRARIERRQAHHRLRLQVDGPGLGKGGTACSPWTARKWTGNPSRHGTPITFPEDETFDIGQDTRTGVAMIEYRYDPPFKFTGKINKLTFKLEPETKAATEPRAELAPMAAPEPDPIEVPKGTKQGASGGKR